MFFFNYMYIQINYYMELCKEDLLLVYLFYRENTTSSTLIESDEFLIPLHLKFTERDCKLGLTHGQCANDQYRSLDGSCNNMVYPTWGMAGQVLRRYLSPGYHDGKSITFYQLDCSLLSFHNVHLGHSDNLMFM